MYTHTQESQNQISPEEALTFLREGNDRFISNLRANRNYLQQVNETPNGQFPFATILSCMDSRTSAELIFDQGLGDIFSIRIAGNVLNNDVIGSMEYATNVVGTKVIMVLGHTKCGAIEGACNGVELGNLTQLLEKIRPAIAHHQSTTREKTGNNPDFVHHVTELNVLMSLQEIRSQSPIIAQLEQEGKVKIVGGMYDLETGKVDFYE